MATSNSINFTLTRDEIIQDALELIGAVDIGATPSATDITTCARTLNLMVKSWQATGVHLWTETEMSLSLVADQRTYVLSPKPLFIKSARHRTADTDYVDRPVRIDTRNEYNEISNKTSTGGTTSRIYYDSQLGDGTLYVWPVPEASTDTLQLTYLRSIEDFDASGDNADFPTEWLEALIYNLAVRIAPKYGKVLSKENPDIINIALTSLQQMQLWDTESSTISIVPARDYSA